jgi:hypothetical protein
MTREQVKQVLPLMQAFAEGKTIQTKNGSTWIDIDSDKNQLILDSVVTYQDCFRVKPKDVYRPFCNAEECWQEMQKHKPFGWVEYNGCYFNIVYIDDHHVALADEKICSILLDSERCRKDIMFPDGTPFGIKEEY